MTSRDLAGCPLAAAFAEAQRAINEHIARTKRIAFSPTNSLRRRGLPQAIQRKDASRLDFIPPKADRKTASSLECFQVRVIKVEVKVFVGQRIDGIPSVVGQRETMTRSIEYRTGT